MTQSWGGWAGDVAKAHGDRRRDVGRRRRAAGRRDAALRPRAGGCPARPSWSRFGVAFTYAGAGRARPAVQPLHAAARRAARAPTCSSSRGKAGRQRRRGLRGRRLAAHDGRQRLRDRHRPHQARRALRHAAEGLHAGRGRGSSSPTSSATCATATCRTGCSAWRSSRRSGCSRSRALGERLDARARRHRRARRGARARADRARHHDRSPTSSRARSSARADALLARAHRRARRADRLPAPDRAPERRRPRPAGLGAFLLGTHPTTMQRIGQALAFERSSGRSGPRAGS